jgi:hypothetical protein
MMATDSPLPHLVSWLNCCWHLSLASLKPECHAIMNKFPEAASLVQQIYKLLNDIEILPGCTPAKVGESSE